MTIFEGILLGFIQGITEFLPVSSSGHLWIFETLVFGNGANIALEAFLHVSTLLAVVIFFRGRIWNLCKDVFRRGEALPRSYEEKKFARKLLLATGATFPVALMLKPFVEFDLTKEIVALTLMITALLVLISEYCRPSTSRDFSWQIAILLGVVQGIAVIPGISRSGITIVFLLLMGIEWKKSLEISFLLSIPTILGAFVFLLPELKETSFNLSLLIAGGSVAFLSALGAIWAMVGYVERYWKYFSVWCGLVAIALIVL